MKRASTARKAPDRSRASPKVRRARPVRHRAQPAKTRPTSHRCTIRSTPAFRSCSAARRAISGSECRTACGNTTWAFRTGSSCARLWLKDGITQRELCKRIEAPEPAAVAALRELERQGYVRRVRDKDNMRKILVFITPKGHALRKKLLPHAYELASMGVKGIPEHEVALLRSLLNRIRDNMVAALQAELGEVDN